MTNINFDSENLVMDWIQHSRLCKSRTDGKLSISSI